jgi:foldase protein PrsA
MTFARIQIACAAVVALGAATIAGCGNDVPAGSVAKVGDTTIEKSVFDKWLESASSGSATAGQTTSPDPPNFAKCVAAKKKQPVPKGSSSPSEASLKKQCKSEYDQLKGDVMQFLIQAQWVEQEAAKRGIKVSDQEVKNRLNEEKQRAFPGKKGEERYQQFLKTSGMSEEDILFRFKLEALQQKLTQNVTEKESKVTDKDVEDYYAKNKKRFAQPEQRDLNLVLTKTKAKADQAKSAIQDGGSFKTVSKKFSIDEASKQQGGKLPAVAEGQQEKAFNDAIFSAKRGSLQGPVKTQFGYYVFQVTKVKPASQQSLDESRETIKNLLKSQRQQKSLDKFIKDFRKRYKEMTICADDYEVAECKNAPKGKTDTGAASGGNPQGQPQAPQGQPQAPQGQPQAPQGQPQAPQGGGTQTTP